MMTLLTLLMQRLPPLLESWWRAIVWTESASDAFVCQRFWMTAAVIAIDVLLVMMTVAVPVIAAVVHWLLSLLPLHAFSPSPLDAA